MTGHTRRSRRPPSLPAKSPERDAIRAATAQARRSALAVWCKRQRVSMRLLVIHTAAVSLVKRFTIIWPLHDPVQLAAEVPLFDAPAVRTRPLNRLGMRVWRPHQGRQAASTLWAVDRQRHRVGGHGGDILQPAALPQPMRGITVLSSSVKTVADGGSRASAKSTDSRRCSGVRWVSLKTVVGCRSN